MQKKGTAGIGWIWGLLILGLSAPAIATDLGSKVQIHGFGGWFYADTDGLLHIVGDSDGDYDNAQLALNVTAQPTDRLSVVAQVLLEAEDRFADEDVNVELDYAFAEWFVSDRLKLRVGRVKHPYGIYGEIFEVGTLRPFILLPLSLYGPSGFTAKAYNGVGITGTFARDSGWGLQYDVYGGQIEGAYEVPGLFSGPDTFTEPRVDLGFTVDDILGTRLNVLTPFDGLSFGVSAYLGEERILDVRDRETIQAHVEYLTDRWTVRGEWGLLDNKGAFDVEGSYLEVAYKITEHWELAVRGEDRETDFNLGGQFFSGIVAQATEHQDVALGVSYWFSPSFVLRLNVHETEGNRFAFVETPEEVQRALVTGELEDETELILIGAQFSF